jgi:flagellar basal-body rod protein FlgC
MSLFNAIQIAGSGMDAERVSMDVTAENLANAQSTTTNGKPYQPQTVELSEVSGSSFQSALDDAITGAQSDSGPVAGSVEVAGIESEPSQTQLVYDPGNPNANKQGYVAQPDISTVTQMVNLIDESNSYQADVTAMQTAKDMYNAALSVLK